MSNMGQLIDDEGNVVYHIVSSGTTKLVISLFGVLLVALMLMMIVVLMNRKELQRIESEQEQFHNKNATYNSNR